MTTRYDTERMAQALFNVLAKQPEAIIHVSSSALCALLRWNDPNGDFETLNSRDDLIAALRSMIEGAQS